MESSSTSRVLPGAREGAASRLVNRIMDLVDNFNNYGYGASLNDPVLLSRICFSLSRGIDYAIANNEVPLRSRDLSQLLYQVLVYTEDVTLQQALPRLIICTYGACNLHWFSDQDTDNLLSLSKDLLRYFSDTTLIRVSPSVLSSVEKVTSRFYPNMKTGKVLASLELQPGLRSYAAPFPIIRGMLDPKQEKIWLFGAQIDSIDTSSCIITPPEVNFLLNGKVVGRNLGSMDKVPQQPINVTHMVKFGVNILHIVGDLPGEFLLIVATMYTVPCSDAEELHNFVSPAPLNDSEAAVADTPSIISLNCPRSQARMRTPLKGKLCRHAECFDHDIFLEINSKMPSWQCPHCKQSVCYQDLHVDQSALKVLMEADENVVNVIVSSDGSWEEIKDHSTGRDTFLPVDHDKNGSAVGNSIPYRTISFELSVPVDSYMDLLMADIATSPDVNMPADDRKQVVTSQEENKSSPSRKRSTKFPAFDLNEYPVSDD